MSLLAVLTVLALAGDATPPPTLRLPGGVRPLRQAVDLTLDPARETFSGSVEIDLDVREPLPVLWLNAVGLKLSDASIRRDGKASPLRVVPGGEDFVGFAAERAARAPARPSCWSDSRAGCLAATTRASSPCRRRTPGTSSASSRRSRHAAPSRASTSPATRSPGTSRCACRAAPWRSPTPRPRRRAPRARATSTSSRGRRRCRATWSPSSWAPSSSCPWRPRAASTCPRGSSCRAAAAPTRPGPASRRRGSSACWRTTSTAPTPTRSSTRSRFPGRASRWSTPAS